MKQLLLLITASSLFFTACKKESAEPDINQLLAEGSLEDLKTAREKIQTDYDLFGKDLALLQKKINELDTTVIQYPIVNALKAKDTVFNHYVEVQGSVKTKDDAMVYPEMPGVMTRLYVRDGQYIRKGALVARIDDGGMAQQVAQQEIQLSLAQTTYDRQKRLWDQNIGSEIQYLQAKNQVEALQKAIEAQKRQLSKANVYAPFSGVVEEVITKQGQVVSPGATPLFRLVNLNSLYVEAEVPENYLPTVQKGTNAVVDFEAIGKEYESKVRRVNSTINPNSRSFVIEVGVPGGEKLIKPNLIANLKLNDYSNEDAILLPSDIIIEDSAGNQFVYVTDSLPSDNIATVKKVAIETGESTPEGMVEITTGLEAGKMIISEGAKNLNDGDKVEISYVEE